MKNARVFDKFFNLSLFYQNMIKITFFNNSKSTWFRKDLTYKKFAGTLIFESYLVAVFLSGLQARLEVTIRFLGHLGASG
jgi:hypothetical protein